MIDLPPITVEQIDQLIAELPDEDRAYFNQFEAIRVSPLIRFLIEKLRIEEGITFDRFVNNALERYVFFLMEKRRVEKCKKTQNKLHVRVNEQKS